MKLPIIRLGITMLIILTFVLIYSFRVLNPEDKITYLEACYATSTKIPQANYGVKNVFDGDTNTYWCTMKGAGPDEGIMLYFSEETFIKDITIKPVLGNDFAKILKIKLYINGNSQAAYGIVKPISLNKKVKSLFIKIQETNNIKKLENSSYNNFNDRGERNSSFITDKNIFVGIKEILITDVNGSQIKINTPLEISGKVEASSTLSPQTAYSPNNLFDNKKETAWSEGNSTNGENEELSFHFDKQVNITNLKIWNGYQRSDKHYTDNTRVKSFEFGSKNGISGTYNLSDIQTSQNVMLNNSLTDYDFLFKIKDIYKGDKYADLAISELHFYNGNIPFILNTGNEDATKTSLMNKIKGTTLESIIDRRYSNFSDESSITKEKSIIIRSNLSFVEYEIGTSDHINQEEYVMEGNWELLQTDKNKSTIRVFGKYYKLKDGYGEYKGKIPSNAYVKIFQDTIIVANGNIKGGKYMESFDTRENDINFVTLKDVGLPFILDIKYATEDNFLKEKVYDCAECLVRNELVDSLFMVSMLADQQGYKIKFFDCYRPLSVQEKMWKIKPDSRYVANPKTGSSHNRGGAVDITLVDKETGKELDMGTPFDFFGEEAHHDYTKLPQQVLDNRKLLKDIMEKYGFKALNTEWWHYTYKDASKFPISNEPIICDK